jgi:hypothetical protein
MRLPTIGAIFVLLVVAFGAPTMLAMQATPEPPASPVAAATPVEPEGIAFDPEAAIYGASLGQWSARYWQWVTSLPVGVNPAHDPSGARCGYGQHGPVFFVPRHLPPCTVPADIAVFVPIAGSECSTLEPPPFHGANEEELAACAAGEADRYTDVVVRVNGELVPQIERYRAQSPTFTLQVPEDNILAVPAGMGRAVADGYQVILAPLAPGTHEIVVHVEVTEGYALPDKTLRLTVVEPARTRPRCSGRRPDTTPLQPRRGCADAP